MKCKFCAVIIKTKIENDFIEWNKIASFRDIKPAGEIHFLLIPKIHISDALELTDLDFEMLEEMKNVADYLLKRDVKVPHNMGPILFHFMY